MIKHGVQITSVIFSLLLLSLVDKTTARLREKVIPRAFFLQ